MDFKDLIKERDCEQCSLSLDIMNEAFENNILVYSKAFNALSNIRESMSPYEEYLFDKGFQAAIAILSLNNLAGE